MDNTLLDQAIDLFHRARSSLMHAAQALYTVQQTEAWKERYDSWNEFVEDGLQISPSMASKLLKVQKHFVINAGYETHQLEGIDSEKLYLAINTKGTPDIQLERARSLTRSELKKERSDIEPCQEHKPITICSVCHERL